MIQPASSASPSSISARACDAGLAPRRSDEPRYNSRGPRRLAPRSLRVVAGRPVHGEWAGVSLRETMTLPCNPFECGPLSVREPTSGLEPLYCSLRVISQALHGVARSCKSRISRRLSLLCLASCCTVLRSRWYQDGISPLRIGHPLVPHLSTT